MLLALDWGLVLRVKALTALFFYSGLFLLTLMFLVVFYYLERHPGIHVEAINPGWYMPAVGTVLVPYVGSVASQYGLPTSPVVFSVYLGTGVLMWISLFTIWLYRAIFYSPTPGRMVATLWINLAPPVVIPLSFQALLGREISRTCPALLMVLYYGFWGAAGLLFVLVLSITIGYAVRGELEFADSWWAFVFPLAAYAISTIHLYMLVKPGRDVLYYAVLLYVLAWASYLVTTGFSLRRLLASR